MNIAKHIWKATSIAFLIGAILAFGLCVLFGTNFLSCFNDDSFSLAVFVALVMGAIYFIIQMSLSAIVKSVFDKKEHWETSAIWKICLKTIAFLYMIVFIICFALTDFDLHHNTLTFILGFSIPYLINCLMFVFLLHYLCWKDINIRIVN